MKLSANESFILSFLLYDFQKEKGGVSKFFNSLRPSATLRRLGGEETQRGAEILFIYSDSQKGKLSLRGNLWRPPDEN
jgi:hypothetical protein